MKRDNYFNKYDNNARVINYLKKLILKSFDKIIKEFWSKSPMREWWPPMVFKNEMFAMHTAI